MAGLLDALSQSARALQVNQLGAQVSGANVGNANAPGYHRADLHIQSGDAVQRGASGTIKRAVSSMLDAQVDAQAGEASYASARLQGLQGAQDAVGDMGPGSLGAHLADFFNGWRAVATAPSEVAARTDTLERLASLVNRFHIAAGDLDSARSQADDQLVAQVPIVNDALDTVARLNGTLLTVEAGGQEADALRDQRDLAVRSLAETLGASQYLDADGSAVVSIAGGVTVVAGIVAYHLGTTVDPTTDMHHLQILGTAQGDIDARLGSGQLAGLVQLRDTDLNTQQAALDGLAVDLTNALNAVHAANYGLDGVSGRNLLAPAAATKAATAIAIDAAVLGQPENLAAAASAAGATADNSGANAMIGVQNAMVALGGTATLGGSLAQAVAAVGQMTALAQIQSSAADNQLSQATMMAEGQEGVSIEGQMMQLSRFQSGYQAAARVVSTIDRMLQSLVSM